MRLLRRKEVEERTGMSKSWIYDEINAGRFPKQRRIGASRSVGWMEDEVDAWIANLPSDPSPLQGDLTTTASS